MAQRLLPICSGWHGKSALVQGTGIAANGWNTAIKNLLAAGQVERQGEKKGARYRILPEHPDSSQVIHMAIANNT